MVSALQAAEKELEIATLKLFSAATTRWNSNFDSAERFLEAFPALKLAVKRVQAKRNARSVTLPVLRDRGILHLALEIYRPVHDAVLFLQKTDFGTLAHVPSVISKLYRHATNIAEDPEAFLRSHHCQEVGKLDKFFDIFHSFVLDAATVLKSQLRHYFTPELSCSGVSSLGAVLDPHLSKDWPLSVSAKVRLQF